MPAPTITLFASNTAPTGPQLDNNFLAYAVFGNIHCTVSGTNTLILTQKSNTPALTQVTNYIQFSGVFANTNTGAVTLTAGSFPILNAYKDSPLGPIALTGGECIAGNAFTARYDSTLNGNVGGYHITTATSFSGGTITGNVVLSSGVLSVLGGSIGASLSSSLLSGNSLTVSALLLTGTSLSGTSLQASIASIASLQVGSGTLATLTNMVSALATLTFTVTPANQTQNQNMTVTGAGVLDVVALGLGTSVPSGAGFTGFCGTIGTVTVRLLNPTAASIAATTMTVRALAMGLTP